ncbi:MAG: hypothetical protein ABI907_10915 [Ramlibacter sp.]
MQIHPLLPCAGLLLAAALLLPGCARDSSGAIIHTPPASSDPVLKKP